MFGIEIIFIMFCALSEVKGKDIFMKDAKFETLIKGKNYKSEERWYPTTVEDFRKGFALDSSIEGYHPLVDNLAYSLQYLEFIEKELSELVLSSVIYTMHVKNYVIISMSILEGVFTNIIKSKDWWKKKDTESILTSQAEQKASDGTTYVIKTEIMKKVDAFDDKMTLDEMIKCLSRHHEALDVDHLVYPALKRLRDLRNRIHLQKGDAYNDHDYNAFDDQVKREMQSILYAILCSPNVTFDIHIIHYDFLKPDK